MHRSDRNMSNCNIITLQWLRRRLYTHLATPLSAIDGGASRKYFHCTASDTASSTQTDQILCVYSSLSDVSMQTEQNPRLVYSNETKSGSLFREIIRDNL